MTFQIISQLASHNHLVRRFEVYYREEYFFCEVLSERCGISQLMQSKHHFCAADDWLFHHVKTKDSCRWFPYHWALDDKNVSAQTKNVTEAAQKRRKCNFHFGAIHSNFNVMFTWYTVDYVCTQVQMPLSNSSWQLIIYTSLYGVCILPRCEHIVYVGTIYKALPRKPEVTGVQKAFQENQLKFCGSLWL